MKLSINRKTLIYSIALFYVMLFAVPAIAKTIKLGNRYSGVSQFLDTMIKRQEEERMRDWEAQQILYQYEMQRQNMLHQQELQRQQAAIEALTKKKTFIDSMTSYMANFDSAYVTLAAFSNIKDNKFDVVYFVLNNMKEARRKLVALKADNPVEETAQSSYLLTMESYIKVVEAVAEAKKAMHESNLIKRFLKKKQVSEKIKEAQLWENIGAKNAEQAVSQYNLLKQQFNDTLKETQRLIGS